MLRPPGNSRPWRSPAQTGRAARAHARLHGRYSGRRHRCESAWDRPQFEQTCGVFASSKPDRPTLRLHQGKRARLDIDSDSTWSAEHATFHRIAKKQAGDAWAEVERRSHRHQTLTVPEGLDAKEAEHIADVMGPARVEPKPQLPPVGDHEGRRAARGTLDTNGAGRDIAMHELEPCGSATD